MKILGRCGTHLSSYPLQTANTIQKQALYWRVGLRMRNSSLRRMHREKEKKRRMNGWSTSGKMPSVNTTIFSILLFLLLLTDSLYFYSLPHAVSYYYITSILLPFFHCLNILCIVHTCLILMHMISYSWLFHSIAHRSELMNTNRIDFICQMKYESMKFINNNITYYFITHEQWCNVL